LRQIRWGLQLLCALPAGALAIAAVVLIGMLTDSIESRWWAVGTWTANSGAASWLARGLLSLWVISAVLGMAMVSQRLPSLCGAEPPWCLRHTVRFGGPALVVLMFVLRAISAVNGLQWLAPGVGLYAGAAGCAAGVLLSVHLSRLAARIASAWEARCLRLAAVLLASSVIALVLIGISGSLGTSALVARAWDYGLVQGPGIAGAALLWLGIWGCCRAARSALAEAG
jgi:hypothetical protein